MISKRIIFFILFSISLLSFNAQCSIDYSYAQSGIYPNPFPIAYAGQAYSQDVTFVMPLDTMGVFKILKLLVLDYLSAYHGIAIMQLMDVTIIPKVINMGASMFMEHHW